MDHRALVAIAIASVGCRAAASEPARITSSSADVATSSAPPSVASVAPEKKPEFVAPTRDESLPIPGFAPAVVSVPRDASAASPRPVVVALHGHGEVPDHPCAIWRSLVGARAFIVCPRGAPVPGTDGFTYVGEAQLANEVVGALDAVKSRYGAKVAEGPALFSGFSLGASLAVALLAREPKRFSAAVLIEGGVMDWSGDRIARFVYGHGGRLLFLCGRDSRRSVTSWIADTLVGSGAQVHRVFTDAGHTDEGAMEDALAAELPWLEGADPRWELPGGEPAP